MIRNIGDITGKRFGRLVAIERVADSFTPSNRRIIRYKCYCDCGKEKIVDKWHLTSGKTISCGCYQHERQIECNTTHGMRDTRLYYIWCGMKQRCKDKTRMDYGGKGISICDEWKDDFQAFYDWSVNNGYRDDLSIDRIDVNGNYEPDNCRWADAYTQMNNTTRNHYITIDGETKTLIQWSRLSGINQATIRTRIKRGMDEKSAVFTPLMK